MRRGNRYGHMGTPRGNVVEVTCAGLIRAQEHSNTQPNEGSSQVLVFRSKLKGMKVAQKAQHFLSQAYCQQVAKPTFSCMHCVFV